MKAKIIFSIVVVVGVIALALYINMGGMQQTPSDKNPSQNQNQAKVSPTGDVLAQLGTPPSGTSTAEEQNAFGAKLRSLATAADKVSIGSGCALSPAIISLKKGTALTFDNKDNVNHDLSITETVQVRAGTESTIKATFKGPGVYGITCDGPSIVGFIDLTD
jgi:plastocyanin